MTALTSISKDEWHLIATLVKTAWVDGRVAPLEVAFIESAMKAIHVSEDDRKAVRRMLDGTEPVPEVNDTGDLDYETRLSIFSDAIELAFSDGVFNLNEKTFVHDLVNRLDLGLDDVQRIWARAKHRYPDTVS